MSIDAAALEEWFRERPVWLQDAARRLFQAGNLTAHDLDESLVLCKREAGISVAGYDGLEPMPILGILPNVPDAAIPLRLEVISDVKGINAMAPRKPLEFGAESLVVVYGGNGSGKSGYIRLLKHACGGRGRVPIHGNVFADVQDVKSCNITYRMGAEKVTLAWKPELGAHADLRAVSLYDTDCANVYINNENEVTYEPVLLSYFRVLVELCEKVDARLSAEISAQVIEIPILPTEYASTESGRWFEEIDWQTSEAEIAIQCDWSVSQETELAALNERLAEKSPLERAEVLRKAKGYVSDLMSKLTETYSSLSDASFASFASARASARAKRQAADEDAEKIFENALLTGIGSESWQLLWEQARIYSEGEAYKEKVFPYLGEEALCVLCQQPLEAPARERFGQFEAFIKDRLKSEAVVAENLLSKLVSSIKEPPTGVALTEKLDLAGLSESIRIDVRDFCEDLSKRRTTFLFAMTAEELAALPSADVVRVLADVAGKHETDAYAFEEAAKADRRAEIKRVARGLGIKKWLSQHREAISAEAQAYSLIHLLEQAQRLTNTTALSTKKSALADVVVTDAFKARFEAELKVLGAPRIGAGITKTRTEKGQVWHQVILKGTRHSAKAREILSEGEYRIVSLAAFLADVISNGGDTPFVFDDPISSLDQDFEEAAAARLVDLSNSRQVIVFTHRLSLLALLEDAAKKRSTTCHVISVQREPWGTGEPNPPPLPVQKPKTALNTLHDQRLAKAKQVWSTEGTASYQVEAKALCSDIRITIERLIENELLADVIQRFRRPINTMGKLEKLARIKATDCVFIDAMMTKYSRYEHSQPDEAPVALPEPDEIASDLTKLKAWLDEFNSRVVAAA